ADQVPAALGPDVRHFAYAPLGSLLPRSSALVHHGGVGTAAEALLAGVPQLIVPTSHDQPDNAARLERLGVAESIPSRRASAPAMGATLAGLLSSLEGARRCPAAARRMKAPRGLAAPCRSVEELGQVRRSRHAGER